MNKQDVSLCYVSPELQCELSFPYQPGLTVAVLLTIANLPTRWPTVAWEHCTVGIWGKNVDMSTLLQPGDRVELYRPLIIDPKTARRLRSPKNLKRPRVRHRRLE